MSRQFIIKASGRRVPFDRNKVIGTCIRAGASRKIAERIVRKIKAQIHEGSTTLDVYKMVLREIATEDKGVQMKHRYRLKESLMLLGPAGYHFEAYVSRVLQDYGYAIEGIQKLVNGKCVRHEIDIVAKHPSQKRMLIECKYHNFRGIFTRLKETLYTHARFLDLSELFDGEMLVTNTKISDDAKKYSKCIGQDLIAWKYPSGGGLEKMIQKKSLYPITILSLRSWEFDALSKKNIMLAKDLQDFDVNQLSKMTGIPHPRIHRLQSLVSSIID